MFCPKCGRQNPDGAKFCGGCGGNMPAMQAQPVQTPPPVAPPPQPVQPMMYQQQPAAPAQMPYVPSNMGLAIFVLVCCCQILGIVAVVYAAQVKGKLAAGDLAGAQAASASARKWAIIGIIGGLIIYAIFALTQLPAILEEM